MARRGRVGGWALALFWMAACTDPAPDAAPRVSVATSSAGPPPPPPSGGPPPPPPGGAPPPPGGSVGPPVQRFLTDTVAPLQRASVELGDDPAAVLPTPAELEAAIASDSLDSAESVVVLDKLREGYARYNMPFPKPGPAPGGGGGGDIQAVRTWLAPTIENLAGVAADRGDDPARLVPSDAEIAAAQAALSPDDPAVVLVIGKLRAGYSEMGMDLPEPGKVDAAAPPPPPGEGAAGSASGQGDIIRAYFQVAAGRVKRAGAAADVDVSAQLPDDEMVAAAVASGDLSSAASVAALAQLERAHAAVGLQFQAPRVE